MKKLTLALLVVFSVATVNTFAADKDNGKKKEMKCSAGSDCCKKTSKTAATDKAKTAKPAAKKA